MYSLAEQNSTEFFWLSVEGKMLIFLTNNFHVVVKSNLPRNDDKNDFPDKECVVVYVLCVCDYASVHSIAFHPVNYIRISSSAFSIQIFSREEASYTFDIDEHISRNLTKYAAADGDVRLVLFHQKFNSRNDGRHQLTN